jgi:hypothetical protein
MSMAYFANWSSIYNYMSQRYNNLWTITTQSSSESNVSKHPNARPPQCALRHRFDECTKAKIILKGIVRSRYPYAAAEVSFRKKSELIDALKPFPSIELNIFSPEEYITFITFRITDELVIDQLLQQDWFLSLDNSQLTLGNPANQ